MAMRATLPLCVQVVFRSSASAPPDCFPAIAAAMPPDSFLLAWYGGALAAMHEPPLCGAVVPEGVAVWRFLWLRSFHPPVAVRILRAADRCLVTTVALTRPPEMPWPASGVIRMFDILRFGPPGRRDSTEVVLTSCDLVRDRLAAADFWRAAARASTQGVDGAEWVTEVVTDTRYRLVTRWSPDSVRAPAFRSAGLAFLAIGRARPSTALYWLWVAV